ncbi:MAG: RNB domain-containing ribonuclease, partial [Candidatus Aminicenantales bacterium]
MSLAKIAQHLHLSPGEKARLGKTLRDLENQGVVLRVKKRYVLRPREEIVRGRFVASPRGFGFVIAEEEHLEDVYVPGEQSRGALHGDVVEVFIRRKGRAGKTEGRVIRILERGSQSLLGVARVEGGQTFFLPFSSPTSQEIAVVCPKGKRPETGDIIRVERESLKIREVLGPADAPGVDTRVVIERHNLETGFSAETREEAEEIPERLSPKDREGREDLAGWRIITIDGENARDFDDAVSIRKTPGGYCLGVHIADVSHYVRPGTAIDRDAFRRGTSVYFPELTLPMLPEKLSNRVCSLRPGEPKLTVSVLMDVDEEGRVTRTRFAPSFIRTAARMTYDSVLRILKRQGGEKGLFTHQALEALIVGV